MTNVKIILISTISAIISGLVVAILFVLSFSPFFNQPSPKYVPGTGYEMLANFQCRFGEQKHIFFRGADDDFTLGNPEPSRRIPGLEDFSGYVTNFPYLRDYDEMGPDKILSDFIEVPPNVSRGLFLIRFEDKGRESNDTFQLGNFTDLNEDYYSSTHHTFNALLKSLGEQAGWNRNSEGITSVLLKDIKFQYYSGSNPRNKVERVHETLLAYLQDRNSDHSVSVLIYDDTAVDYMGLAVCTTPAEKMGLTYAGYEPMNRIETDVQVFSCELEIKSHLCNPFIGDTVCTAELPLACVKDTGAPVPELGNEFPYYMKDIIETFWAAGEIELTPPVRGDTFQTLADANAFCRAQFGESWRVLDYHDGGARSVAGRRLTPVPNKGRVWLDIKDQPFGTCWARDEAHQKGALEALK